MGLINPINIPPVPGHFISAGAAGGDPTVVKANPSSVKYLMASNINAAARYLKVYNKSSAPTSSDTPVHTFIIPGNTAGAGTNLAPEGGINLDKGFAFRLVTGAADNDNTAVASAEIIVNWGNSSFGIDTQE